MKPARITLITLLFAGLADRELRPAQDELPPAIDVLDAVARASGELSTLKTITTRGSVRSKTMNMMGRFEEFFVGAQQVRMNSTFEGMGTGTQGVTKDFAWTSDETLGITIARDEQRHSVHRMLSLPRQPAWSTLYETAETLAVEATDDGPRIRIRMTPKQGAPDVWTIDPERHVVTRVDLKVPNPGGGDLGMSFEFSDFRMVKGVRLPHRRSQLVGTIELQYIYDEVRLNEEVTPEQVGPSEEVMAAANDPNAVTGPQLGNAGEYSIEVLEEATVASIRVQTTPAEVSQALAKALPEVLAYVGQHGATFTGPPFTRYHSIGDDKIELETGIPIQGKIPVSDRVKPSKLPAGKTAITWHAGPYDKLSETYDKLEQWMKENSHESAGGFWEVYWTDPGLEPDPKNWKTQVLWPVKSDVP